MMDKKRVIHEIGASRVVPVVRTRSADEARKVIDTVIRGGCRVVEITMTIPGAIELIRETVLKYPEILVGAGTIWDVEQVKACVAVGANFIVSPWTDSKVVEFSNRAGIVVMPGALTPTEVRNAVHFGADIVKIFPAHSIGGAAHVRALKSVMPDALLIPTGGVTVQNAADYLRAGAFAVGIGSDLVKAGHLSNDDAAVISRIRDLVGRLTNDFVEASPPS